MKRFADSLARQKGIKPPPGYKTSISSCRKFLNEHAPKKADGETAGKHEPKLVSPAQLFYAKKIAQGKGLVIPDEAKAGSAAMSRWIDSNQVKKSGKNRRKRVNTPMRSIAPKTAVPRKKSRKRATNVVAAAIPSTPARRNSETDTPLRIPYGNKEAALRLVARYRAGGWYAPAGVDLAAHLITVLVRIDPKQNLLCNFAVLALCFYCLFGCFRNGFQTIMFHMSGCCISGSLTTPWHLPPRTFPTPVRSPSRSARRSTYQFSLSAG